LGEFEEFIGDAKVSRRLAIFVLVIGISPFHYQVFCDLFITVLACKTQHSIAIVIRFVNMKW
jgi:hypothetical protein